MVNTPVWYNTLYTILKPIMSDICEAKLVFLTAKDVQRGKLLQYIPASNLPLEYGGRSKVALGEAKVEQRMRAYVDKVNRKAGVRAIRPCEPSKEMRARVRAEEAEERSARPPPFWAKWLDDGKAAAERKAAEEAEVERAAHPPPWWARWGHAQQTQNGGADGGAGSGAKTRTGRTSPDSPPPSR